jgi:pimeloyl-ACP methyl ester carboxylesterase
MRNRYACLALGIVMGLSNTGVTQAAPVASPARAAPAQPAAAFGQGWRSVDCSSFGIPEALAPVADCGYLSVPAIRSQPKSGSIEIAVARIRSTGAGRQPDPLFIEQGGPGGSTIEFAQALGALPGYEAPLATRDLVFVEQRGTRYSKPYLGCAEMALAQIRDLETARNEKASGETDAAQACALAYQRKQVNLQAFNTVENAEDMIAAADALGYRQINFYGVSYGTALGQYLMRQHPERLRSVILDGVVPIDVYASVVHSPSRAFSSAFRAVVKACQADTACRRSYPDLEAVFFGLVEQLRARPLKISADFETLGGMKELEVTDRDLLNAVFQSMYNIAEVAALPERIYRGRAGDWEWLTEALEVETTSDAETATMMHSAIDCGHAGTLNSAAALKAVIPEAAYGPMGMLDDNPADVTQQCALLAVAPLSSQHNRPVRSDIPALVLSGEFDPITPHQYAERVASSLGKAYVFTVPGETHGVLGQNPCVTQIVLQFLNRPAAPPSSSCLATLKPAFNLPLTPLDKVTPQSLEVAPGFRTVLPAQWAKRKNYYSDANDPQGARYAISILAADSLDVLDFLATLKIDPEDGIAYEGQHLSWAIYQVTQDQTAALYAVSPVDEGGVVVILASSAADIGDLFEQVGKPALDAFEPIKEGAS